MAGVSKQSLDKLFVGIIVALVVFGLLVFLSAAFSVLAKSEAQFYRMLLNQIVLGLIGGGTMLFALYRVEYTFWKKYALIIFICSLIATLAVFVPFLGISHGGARRWIVIGPFSFQPAEFLKIAYVMYLAAWLSWIKEKITLIRWGLLPFGIMTAISVGVLLMQPDTGTAMVMVGTGIALYFISGARWRDIGIIILTGIVGLGLLVATRPYVLQRFETFINPASDPLGSSYQIQQSLIAIGSGKITGRGFGQSVQKFDYLPEPTGDSIFAVIGEEFGFIGAVFVIFLFLAFLLRGIHIARRTPNNFARLLATGLVLLIVFQAFVNIASVIGVFPLTGLPLIFISQGGTALFFSLAAVGVILNISKYRKK